MMRQFKAKYKTLSKVEAKLVRWLWQSYIAYGMLCILEGDPGIGKSFFTMYLAAIISTGGTLPCGQKVERGRVLLLSAEDDAAYTIRPRIDAMGGNAKRIRFMEGYSPFNDEGLKALRTEVSENKPSAIIVDPIYAFVPGTSDVFKPNQIRALLAEITEVAAKCGAALIILRHLRKSRSDNAVYQGSGSIDVIAAARSALLIAIDPDDEDARLVMPLKFNLSPRGPTWRYRLVANEEGEMPHVVWDGKSEFTAADYHSGEDQQSAVEAAGEYLTQLLEKGPRPQAEIMSMAGRRSYSKRAIERAKQRLDIKSRKNGSHWVWELPKTERETT